MTPLTILALGVTGLVCGSLGALVMALVVAAARETPVPPEPPAAWRIEGPREVLGDDGPWGGTEG